MNLTAKDLRGNWYNTEFIVFSFYPQDSYSTDFKCSINIYNDGKLIYDGDVTLEKSTDENSFMLIAGENIFKIRGYDRDNNLISIQSDDFGNIEVEKK